MITIDSTNLQETSKEDLEEFKDKVIQENSHHRYNEYSTLNKFLLSAIENTIE